MSRYIPNPHHRNKNPNKSQWDPTEVTIEEEEKIWLSSTPPQENIRYGLNIKEYKSNYLGFPAKNSPSKVKKLFIAKFRCMLNGEVEDWHGYPVDTTLSPKDVPDENSLKSWEHKNYISKAQMRKIKSGKKCDL